MAVTGTNVIDRLNSIFADSGNAKWTAAQKLEFVNAAVDDAWGLGLKDVKWDTSITLDEDTFEYTPTATPELEVGFTGAYVVPISTTVEPKVHLRQVYQKLNGTTWTIIIPKSSISTFDGKVLHLQYLDRVARISAASSSIELPLEYLAARAAFYACLSAAAAGANFNARPFEAQIPVWMRLSEQLALSVRRLLPATKLPMGYDTGNMGGATVDWNSGKYNV